MKTRWIVAALLAFFVLATVAAADNTGKKYRISLNQAVKVGTAELAPGDYHLYPGSPKVRFVHIKTGNEIEVEASVQTAEKKHDSTAITTSHTDGGTKLSLIEIGGSTTKIAFP